MKREPSQTASAKRGRERRARLAREYGRDYTPSTFKTAEERRRDEIEYMRRRRREAAEREGRELVCFPWKYQAHVLAWRTYMTSAHVKHDAHVRRLMQVMRDRREWHETDKHRATAAPKRIARRKRDRDELRDSYIVRLLTDNGTNGLVGKDIPQALIDVKREHVRLVRLLNDLKGK